MKRIKNAVSGMLVAALSCAVLAGQASAASGDGLWADVGETSGEVSAAITTNVAVADGVIDVTFNTEKLTYTGCDFNGGQDASPYVAMYAVNDTQADQGVLKISWITTDGSLDNGNTVSLFQINFQGSNVAPGDLTISGQVNDAQGQAVTVVQDSTQPTPSTAPSTSPSANPTTAPGQGNGGANTQRPETGDTANLTLYVGLVAVCVVVLGGLGIWAYKRRGEK